MNFFNQVPFLRILLPFIFGAIAWLLDYRQAPQLVFAVTAYGICVAVFILTTNKTREVTKIAFGITTQLFLFASGWMISQFNDERENPGHYISLLSQQPEYFSGYIGEIPVEKAKSIKAEIVLQQVKVNGQWKNTSGKIIAYFERSPLSAQIETGQTIVFNGALSEVAPPLNPNEFDYKNYLSRKNIYYTTYLHEQNWKTANGLANSSLFTYTQKIRKYLLDTYRNSGLGDEEFSLVAALVLGYDDEIDRPLMDAYSHTGTLHVLSVSGLHVGIIYMLLGYLLSFMDKKKNLAWLKVFLILGFLWFFVLLSGFSAPAVRAALMFSLILLGKTLFENVEVANIVFVSAFLSLLYNPFWLADAGFQLSYLAVLGIIYLYPYFNNLFEFSSSWAEKIWALCSVSIAAQLSTLPVTLYYFHQFPVLFLVTNLILIPVSTIVMYGGMLILIFSKVVFLSKGLVWLTAALVKFMNGCALFFDKLPFCVIDNIHLSILNMLLMYILLVLVFLAIERRSYKLLLSSFSLTAVMLVISLYFDMERRSTREMIVFHSDKSCAMGIYNGNEYIQVSDSTDSRLKEILRQNKIYHDFISERNLALSNTSLIFVGNEKFLFVKKKELFTTRLISVIEPDHVWMPAYALKRNKKATALEDLIVSGTFRNKNIAEYPKDTYITGKKGAFVVSLP